MANAPARSTHHSSVPPPLVGRDREQALLRECLAAALGGRGGLVLLGGEAGIGKTALAEWLCAEAAGRGALVLIGHCYDLAETPPYGPWRDLVARYPAGAVPPPPAPFARRGVLGAVASQQALLDAVSAWLAALAARQPLVLLLDDLHWADPASLDLLRVLARDLGALSVLLLVTYRSDELPRQHPLAALLPRLVREAGAARLELRPLDAAAVRSLTAARYALAAPDLARLVAYLQARAEGNPFYLGELLRAIEDERLLRATGDGDDWSLGDLTAAPMPPLLRQVIAERAARLGGEAARLLTLAAVVGQEVSLALWAAVADTDEDALLDTIDRAVAARLLAETADGQAVRFVHALIREALYDGMLAPRRRRVHRRAAEVLAAAPNPDPDAVSYHFLRAGDARAAEWLLRAGERAQAALRLADRGGALRGSAGPLGTAGGRCWRARLATLPRGRAALFRCC